MKLALWPLLAMLIFASAAHASALDDGNAGLEALNGGDYDKAISLFSRAINSGELNGDDREFAYANRGRAYLKKGDLSPAIIDLDRARREKPDDADAQNDLVAALSTKLPAATIPGLPKPNPGAEAAKAVGKAIVLGIAAGLLAGLAGGQ
jgi:tetratricopeptide (TPR) repeat protein